MRILLLTQFFDPEPTLKGEAFAKMLAERGHQVEVLTGFPNYPGGKLYEGFRQGIYKREIHGDVVVHRVPLYPSHDRSALRRVFNYCSFALSACVIGPWVLRKPDAVWVHHPPLTTGLVARWFKLIWGAPFAIDIHDLWPDSLAATGMCSHPGALRVIDRLANGIYRSAAQILVISPGFRERLLAKGVPAAKIRTVYTWCDESKVSCCARDNDLAKRLGIDGEFVVMFAGTMGLAQALEPVLQAASIHAKSRPKTQFVFVGSGVDSERLKHKAYELGLINVLFLDRRPMDQMGPILALADALLVHLKDDPLFAITVPGKTQTYMRVGKPVLMAVRGDAADLVHRAGAGVICEPEDATSLANAVEKLCQATPDEREAMGERGRRYYESELSMASGIEKIEQALMNAAVCGRISSGYARWGKRLLDIGLTVPALILLAPLMGLISILVKSRLGSPVLFTQERPGLHEKIFRLRKFRSMLDRRGPDGETLPDGLRLTRFGRKLRSMSLDELPELWNVLKGEMSLIGPRPLLVRYGPFFTIEERIRFAVKPGITGLAQVHGRNDLAWDDRLQLDIDYVRNLSLRCDLQILFDTVRAVLDRRGVDVNPSATMLDFDAYRSFTTAGEVGNA